MKKENELELVYEKAKKRMATKKKTDEIKALREEVRESINGDRYFYLLLKSQCDEKCDYGKAGYWVASVALLISILSILVSASSDLIQEYPFLAVLFYFACIAYVYISAKNISRNMSDAQKYRIMSLILEELNNEVKYQDNSKTMDVTVNQNTYIVTIKKKRH